MLKRIPRFTPPEVIVGLLAPYVRLSTSSVRVMKNKAGRMGYTYGFIELDSHAVRWHSPCFININETLTLSFWESIFITVSCVIMSLHF